MALLSISLKIATLQVLVLFDALYLYLIVKTICDRLAEQYEIFLYSVLILSLDHLGLLLNCYYETVP